MQFQFSGSLNNVWNDLCSNESNTNRHISATFGKQHFSSLLAELAECIAIMIHVYIVHSTHAGHRGA